MGTAPVFRHVLRDLSDGASVEEHLRQIIDSALDGEADFFIFPRFGDRADGGILECPDLQKRVRPVHVPGGGRGLLQRTERPLCKGELRALTRLETVLLGTIGDLEDVIHALDQQSVADQPSEPSEIFGGHPFPPSVFRSRRDPERLAQRLSGNLRRDPEQQRILGRPSGDHIRSDSQSRPDHTTLSGAAVHKRGRIVLKHQTDGSAIADLRIEILSERRLREIAEQTVLLPDRLQFPPDRQTIRRTFHGNDRQQRLDLRIRHRRRDKETLSFLPDRLRHPLCHFRIRPGSRVDDQIRTLRRIRQHRLSVHALQQKGAIAGKLTAVFDAREISASAEDRCKVLIVEQEKDFDGIRDGVLPLLRHFFPGDHQHVRTIRTHSGLLRHADPHSADVQLHLFPLFCSGYIDRKLQLEELQHRIAEFEIGINSQHELFFRLSGNRQLRSELQHGFSPFPAAQHRMHHHRFSVDRAAGEEQAVLRMELLVQILTEHHIGRSILSVALEDDGKRLRRARSEFAFHAGALQNDPPGGGLCGGRFSLVLLFHFRENHTGSFLRKCHLAGRDDPEIADLHSVRRTGSGCFESEFDLPDPDGIRLQAECLVQQDFAVFPFCSVKRDARAEKASALSVFHRAEDQSEGGFAAGHAPHREDHSGILQGDGLIHRSAELHIDLLSLLLPAVQQDPFGALLLQHGGSAPGKRNQAPDFSVISRTAQSRCADQRRAQNMFVFEHRCFLLFQKLADPERLLFSGPDIGIGFERAAGGIELLNACHSRHGRAVTSRMTVEIQNVDQPFLLMARIQQMPLRRIFAHRVAGGPVILMRGIGEQEHGRVPLHLREAENIRRGILIVIIADHPVDSERADLPADGNFRCGCHPSLFPLPRLGNAVRSRLGIEDLLSFRAEIAFPVCILQHLQESRPVCGDIILQIADGDHQIVKIARIGERRRSGLAQIGKTVDAPRLLPCGIQRGKKQRSQDRDNSNNHKKFYQGKNFFHSPSLSTTGILFIFHRRSILI